MDWDHCRTSAHKLGQSASVRAEDHDHDGGFPAADVLDLHACGLLLAPFPTSMGGLGLGRDPAALLDVLVALGRGSLSLGRLYEGHVNAVKLVMHYGTNANLDLLLQEVLVGRPSGVWMAETESPVVLEEKAGRRTLKGMKILASGSGHVTRPLIAARVHDGSIMVIPHVTEPERIDTSGWTTLGMRATATGTVDFTGIDVGDDEIIGQPGDYLTSPLFRGGAWRVIAVQLGGVEAILDLYQTQLAGSRNATDALQLARFGKALIAAETARLWVGKACLVAESPDLNPAEIDAFVDLARNAFEEAALSVIALAQKAIGLRAFLRPNPLERVVRDLSTYMRQPALDGSLVSAAAYNLRDRRAM